MVLTWAQVALSCRLIKVKSDFDFDQRKATLLVSSLKE
jgi:hypothetical protein